MNRILTALLSLCMLSFLYGKVYAQTASALIAGDPRGQYQNIKNIIGDAIRSSDQGLFIEEGGNGEKTIELYYCSDYTDLGMQIGKENNRVSQLMSIAFDNKIYSNSLLAVGYPRDVWTNFLNIREQSGLSGETFRYHNTDNSSGNDKELRNLKKFAAILNSYRDHGHRELPMATVEPGCGAGGTTVSFQTKPPGARVLLVPKMYYSLCRIQGIDPDDEKKCDFWHEVFKGQEPEVSGDYFAKIVWQDHSVTRTFSAYKLEEGSNKVTLQ